MTTIVTRSGKGSPLTHTEVDTNFTNLNTAKLEAGAIALGSAATPSISFTGDTSTGIYSPGAYQVAISTNGVERVKFGTTATEVVFNDTGVNYDFRIEGDTVDSLFFVDASTDRVGIGTSSPDGALHVVGGGSTTSTIALNGIGGVNDNAVIAATSSLYYQIDSNNNIGSRVFNWRVGGKGFSNGTSLMTLNAAGQLGIGTTSPATDVLLTVGGTDTDSGIMLDRSAGDNCAIHNNGGAVVFKNGGSSTVSGLNERARIDSSGRLLVGTSNISIETFASQTGVNINAAGTIGASSAGTTLIVNRITSDGTLVGFNRSGNSVGSISVTTTATAFNTSSDYRLKENVTPVPDGITRLQQLRPSRFNFISNSDNTVDGFLAHEVQNIVPEAITGKKDAVDDDGNPVYQGIDQSKLVPLLTAALQEAIAKIESLEARLTAAGI